MKDSQPANNSLGQTVLSDEELDQVSAGGTNKTPRKGDTPTESLSLNFSKIHFTYTSQ